MACLIYDTPAGRRFGQGRCIGHMTSDGKIFHTGSGTGGDRNIGFVDAFGNVYDLRSGENTEKACCVGCVDISGNVYCFMSEAEKEAHTCVGHVDDSGNVYDVPFGTQTDAVHCIGHVKGESRREGAAALLLLNLGEISHKMDGDRPRVILPGMLGWIAVLALLFIAFFGLNTFLIILMIMVAAVVAGYLGSELSKKESK